MKKKKLQFVVKIDEINKLIDELDLRTKCRRNEYLIPRCILYYILKKNTNISLMGIGKLFDKDHATVMNGLRKYDALVNSNDYQFNELNQEIKDRVLEIQMDAEEKVVFERTLIEKVLECDNYFEMRLLQEDLKKTMQLN